MRALLRAVGASLCLHLIALWVLIHFPQTELNLHLSELEKVEPEEKQLPINIDIVKKKPKPAKGRGGRSKESTSTTAKGFSAFQPRLWVLESDSEVRAQANLPKAENTGPLEVSHLL